MVQQIAPDAEGQNENKRQRKHSGLRFPAYDLADSVVVAERIHQMGGGTASDDALAAYLEYKSTNNGAYLARIAAAKLFGLIDGDKSSNYRLTDRARSILMPVYDNQRQTALVEAFMNVPLFKAVYEEMRGRDLPPEFGMKNMLRNEFEVTPSRIDIALRTLMNSAETAGFFAVRGSRTHLILPVAQEQAAPEEEHAHEEESPPNEKPGGGGDEPPENNKPPTAASIEQLRIEYIQMLMAMLRTQVQEGQQPDATLMARIEALLGIEHQQPTTVEQEAV